MRPALFSLICVIAHVSVTVDCRHKLRRTRLQPHRTGRFHADTHADAAGGTGRFDRERSGSTRGAADRGLLVVMPVRTATSNFVSIFDLRRKKFLCMDFKGELYTSRQRPRWDCLFQRLWLDVPRHHGVFYSSSGHRLLTLRGGQLRVARPAAPGGPAALRGGALHPLVKRRRRSDGVNPSDPLRSESHPSLPAKDAEPEPAEQDQAGAVSKETITSCDDPLRVLRPNGHGSPVKTNIADRAEHP
ncbi:uncharacterized protein ACNS7B_007146 [Menidia menidia]